VGGDAQARSLPAMASREGGGGGGCVGKKDKIGMRIGRGRGEQI
jgi:hypothetical protein